MEKSKTSLSAGEIIRAALLANSEVAAMTDRILPVAADSAIMPCITYRRSAFVPKPQKSGQPGADEAQIEVICHTKQYAQGLALAEAVRATLDYASITHDGQRIRSCYLLESEEEYKDGTYMQHLVFSVRM